MSGKSRSRAAGLNGKKSRGSGRHDSTLVNGHAEESVSGAVVEVDMAEHLDNGEVEHCLPSPMIQHVAISNLDSTITTSSSSSASCCQPVIAQPAASSVSNSGGKGSNSVVTSLKHAPTTTTQLTSAVGKMCKLDKSTEEILKALNSLDTPEEKLAALCKKYAEVTQENRTWKSKYRTLSQQAQKSMASMSKLQQEYNKSILAKSRLESLCRELQKQNKSIQEETARHAKEEENRRKEIATSFQEKLEQINSTLQQNQEISSKVSTENDKLRNNNKELTTTLKSMLDQQKDKVEHVQMVMKQFDLEKQLADAKEENMQQKVTLIEKKHAEEKKVMKLELTKQITKCHTIAESEEILRKQVEVYTDKYEEFQDTLNKSDQVFTTFKKEIAKLKKQTVDLDADNMIWQKKWEEGQQEVAALNAKLKNSEKSVKKMKELAEKCSKVARAMQAGRDELRMEIATIKLQNGLTISSRDPSPQSSVPDSESCLEKSAESESVDDNVENEEALPDVSNDVITTADPTRLPSKEATAIVS